MSQSIFLNHPAYGIRVSGDAFTDDPTEIWGTIKLTPLTSEGMGDYKNSIEVYLDENTIREIHKLTGETIAKFENPETPEQD